MASPLRRPLGRACAAWLWITTGGRGTSVETFTTPPVADANHDVDQWFLQGFDFCPDAADLTFNHVRSSARMWSSYHYGRVSASFALVSSIVSKRTRRDTIRKSLGGFLERQTPPGARSRGSARARRHADRRRHDRADRQDERHAPEPGANCSFNTSLKGFSPTMANTTRSATASDEFRTSFRRGHRLGTDWFNAGATPMMAVFMNETRRIVCPV
jgi:hypothetical protein